MFSGVALPSGATLLGATIQITVVGPGLPGENMALDTLLIYMQTNSSTSAFQANAGDISARTKTTSYASWDVPSWDATMPTSTPDLTPVLQEVMASSTNASINNICVIFVAASMTSNGTRYAYSAANNSVLNPFLVISYATSGNFMYTQPHHTTIVSNRSLVVLQIVL